MKQVMRVKPLRWLALGVMVAIGAGAFMALRSHGETLPSDLTLATIEGQAIELDSFKGQPLIINFWATWCPPCIREMPLLSRYDELPGVTVVMINQGETVPVIEGYLDTAGISFRHMLLDPRQHTLQALEIRGLPTTLFYSADGVLVDRHLGEVTAEQLDAFIRRHAPAADRKS